MVSIQAIRELIEVAEGWKNTFIHLMKAPEAPGFEDAMVCLGRMIPSTFPNTGNTFKITVLQQDVVEIAFKDAITRAVYRVDKGNITLEITVNDRKTMLASDLQKCHTECEYDIEIEKAVYTTIIYTGKSTGKSPGKVIRYRLSGINKYIILRSTFQSYMLHDSSKNWFIVTPEIGLHISMDIPSDGWFFIHLHRGLCFLTKTHVYRYTMTDDNNGVISQVSELPFTLDENPKHQIFISETDFLVIKEYTMIYYRIPGWETVPNTLIVDKFSAQEGEEVVMDF